MTHELSPRRNLESLKKEAKRWLDALHAGDTDARARLARAFPDAPATPTLRDVQHAMAREHGFAGWTLLKDAIEKRSAEAVRAGAKALALYEAKADALLDAYRTGTPAAMERHYSYTWHRRAWRAMRVRAARFRQAACAPGRRCRNHPGGCATPDRAGARVCQLA
jgi:hypothetical protein